MQYASCVLQQHPGHAGTQTKRPKCILYFFSPHPHAARRVLTGGPAAAGFKSHCIATNTKDKHHPASFLPLPAALPSNITYVYADVC